MNLDSGAIRRNLMVTSIGFIIYAIGDGKISSKISLPIGIELGDPTVLGCGAWIALVWFYWRFWLYSKNENTNHRFLDNYHRYLEEEHGDGIAIKAASRQVEENTAAQRIKTHSGGTAITGGLFNWHYTIFLTSVLSGKEVDRVITEKSHEQMFFKAWTLLRFCTANSSFGDYLIPHLFFIAALLAGLHSWLT